MDGHHRQAATDYYKEDEMYKRILEKYMTHVGEQEGVDFIGTTRPEKIFTVEEWAILLKLSAESRLPCKFAREVTKQLWQQLGYTNTGHYTLFEKIVGSKIEQYIHAMHELGKYIEGFEGRAIYTRLKHLFIKESNES